MKYIAFLAFFVLFFHSLQADENLTVDTNQSYIDTVHKHIDTKVREWGVGVDSTLLDIYKFWGGELNTSDRSTPHDSIPTPDSEFAHENLLKEREMVDEFFLTQRILQERDKSYVRVSGIYKMNSIEEEEAELKVRARLGLGRSKKHLKLFIEDFRENSAQSITEGSGDNAPSIGIERSSKKRFGIKPRYSIGFRGFDPFVRARYSSEFEVYRWQIEPVQTFRYSLDDEFSEITEIFFDTQLTQATLFRILLDRGTRSRVKGMHYDGFLQYFWTPSRKKALSVNLGFNGSTEYQKIIDLGPPEITQGENRIFNYLFRITWRKQFLKPWLFYEFSPGVNYHEQHGYRPNYNLLFRIDMFFGHI